MKKQKRRAAAKVDQGSKLSMIQPDVAGIDIGAYSGATRTRFLAEGEHHSGLKPNSIPG
jgi:hypothetical protein